MAKLSLYNHFQAWGENHYIAYNAYGGAVALMTKENYAIYQELEKKLSQNTNPALNSDEEKLMQQLKYTRFVCEDDFDEIKAMRFRRNRSKYMEKYLGLTIAPTMACNMACKYCFEGNKQGRMSSDVIENVVKFVRDRAGHIEKLHNTWYGGEPLLAMDIIETLTESFLDLSRSHHFSYATNMISNGVLLTPHVTDRLIDLKVNAIQVTLDGPSRIHDAKRPLKNGRKSFHAILDNVSYAADKMMIGIRVNIDRNFTLDIIEELLEELKAAGLQKKIQIDFGMIFEGVTTACASISEGCFDLAEFARVEVDYYRLLFKHGFRIAKVPAPTSTVCMAQSIGYFLMDHEGELYRCFLHPGDKSKSMGNIRDEVNFDHPNFARMFRFDPMDDENCLSCNFLPLCAGGCPSFRNDRKLPGEAVCQPWKHNLEPMLEIIARAKLQEMVEAGVVKPEEIPV